MENIEQTPYSEGQDAWFEDKSTCDNPYEEGTLQYYFWQLGYKDAEYRYLQQTTG